MHACTQSCSLFTYVGREWCACVRALTRMAWKRTRLALACVACDRAWQLYSALIKHAHKKKDTDKDVCGPEVACTRIRYANQLQIQIREANAFGAVLEDGRVIDGL